MASYPEATSDADSDIITSNPASDYRPASTASTRNSVRCNLDRSTPAADYRPARMTEHVEHGVQMESPPQQLDFYQAMADFRLMFPTMDEEIIEAVLRANNGAVDATIDQLLAMTVDSSDVEDAIDASYRVALEAKLPLESLASSSSDECVEETLAPPPYPPPSYKDYTSSPDPGSGAKRKRPVAKPPMPEPADSILDAPIVEVQDPFSIGECPPRPEARVSPLQTSQSQTTPKEHMVDLLGEDFSAAQPPLPPHAPPLPPKMSVFQSDYTGKSKLVPPRLFKHVRPLLLDELPADFLRISVSPQTVMTSERSSSPHSPGRMVHPVTRSASLGGKHSSKSLPAGTQPTNTHQSHHVGRSHSLHIPSHTTEHLSSEIVQQRLAENERRRLELHDDGMLHPETAQFLEDEHLALMLQNSEFLNELRQDEDFMRTLEKDRMNATAFEAGQGEGPELEEVRPKADQLEGYGDDRSVTLDAFPFDQPLPSNDENAEFRKQLNNMSGSTRKKYTAIARRFFSRRKKKTPKQMLRETSATSTINLLEDEEEIENTSTNGDTFPSPEDETDPFAVPSYRTVQRPPYHPDTIVTYHDQRDQIV